MINVLIVDDSQVSRLLLRQIIQLEEGMTVVGEACDGNEAVQMTAALAPDVITMDMRMPGLNGAAAIKQIMEYHPTPIIVVSAIDENAMSDTEAIARVPKLRGPSDPEFSTHARRLTDAIRRVASEHELDRADRRRPTRPSAATATAVPDARSLTAPPRSQRRDVIAVAASTGGPDAIAEFLNGLPPVIPVPLLIVQHTAKGRRDGLTNWLDNEVHLPVRSAEHRQTLLPGVAVIATDAGHLEASAHGTITVTDRGAIDGHQPSATALFRSVADRYGPRSVGVILTGMGDDGAQGLKSVHTCGGLVLAQDERSSVVHSMPRAARDLGIVHYEGTPRQLAAVAARAVRR